MAETARNMAHQLKRDVDILQYKLKDLHFFTNDLSENSLQINSHVMANMDIFNIEIKHKIELLETNVDGLQTTIQNLLYFLGTEENQEQEVLLDSQSGVAAVPKMRDMKVQVAVDVEVEKKDVSVQMAPMATPNVEGGLEASVAGPPIGSRTEYPPPTARMLAEEEQFDRWWRPTLLCGDEGSLEWTVSLGWWTKFMETEGRGLVFPHILLPSMLEGGKVEMELRKKDAAMELWIWLQDNAYNKETRLPVRVHLTVCVSESATEVEMCAGEGGASWTKLSYTGIIVCELDRGVMEKIQLPKFSLKFSETHVQ